MKAYKKLLLLSAFILSAAAVERLCHHATDGFQLGNIRSSIHASCEPTQISGADMANARSILSQKFHYFGKGAQSYVFASEDGRYILKFFKFQHLRLPPLVEALPMPGSLKTWIEEKRAKKAEEAEALLASYKLAFNTFKEESGLLFAHLDNSSSLNAQISIYDPLNIEHKIEADETTFILQKRADLVLPTLKSHLEKKELQAAKECLTSLVALARRCSEKGIYDRDPHLTKNFGFIENRALLIDCGSLSTERADQRESMKSGSLEQWLADESEELLHFFLELKK